jgi:hypothetical protein
VCNDGIDTVLPEAVALNAEAVVVAFGNEILYDPAPELILADVVPVPPRVTEFTVISPPAKTEDAVKIDPVSPLDKVTAPPELIVVLEITLEPIVASPVVTIEAPVKASVLFPATRLFTVVVTAG